MEEKELKKELAKRKRKATEIAAQIHDIVEETLMSDYKELPNLSEKIVTACDEFYAFKKENSL